LTLSSRRRLLLLGAAVPLVVVVSALFYMQGMALLEGKPRSFWESVEWAAETLTTTGYGFDAHWRHPAMVLLVVAVQFIGVFLVFLVFPIYLIPFLEERFEARLPQEVDKKLADHAVIYRYGPAVETLLDELAAAGVPTLVLEENEAVARRLFERGQRVLHRGLGDGGLEASRLSSARALIANGTDDENAAFILAARSLGFAGPLFALVEEPYHRRPMMLAGASAVFTPRHILGAALAARASVRINPQVAGIQQLGRNLEVAELRVTAASPLAGKTLTEVEIGARTGATVIGQWQRGELKTFSSPEARIEAQGTLVAIGSRDSLGRLARLAGERSRRSGPFVICGFGEVGGKVAELLQVVGEEVKVLDRHAAPGVELVGDVLDARILEAAGVRQAQAVILALSSDSATLFATVILRDLAPDVPIIARVNQAENVDRIHRAGAFFALSISHVSGQMLAKKLLGEEGFAVDSQLKVQQVPAGPLAGQRPADVRVRERTGCSIVAVERGEEVLVEFPPGFRFTSNDAVYVCGSHAALKRYGEIYGRATREVALSG
jgi:Trk K+ transport system NAD-binding subunit